MHFYNVMGNSLYAVSLSQGCRAKTKGTPWKHTDPWRAAIQRQQISTIDASNLSCATGVDGFPIIPIKLIWALSKAANFPQNSCLPTSWQGEHVSRHVELFSSLAQLSFKSNFLKGAQIKSYFFLETGWLEIQGEGGMIKEILRKICVSPICCPHLSASVCRIMCCHQSFSDVLLSQAFHNQLFCTFFTAVFLSRELHE